MTVAELVAEAGGAEKLGHHAGVARVTVYGWVRRGKVPAVHVLPIADALGIPPYRIRPDVFRPDRENGA